MAKDMRLGKLQLELMEVLWESGPSTAREISEKLAAKRVSHSTVQTLLRRLEARGIVRHTEEARTFVFIAAVERDAIQRSELGDLFKGVFRGSASELVSFLIDTQQVDTAELENLRALIECKAKEVRK